MFEPDSIGNFEPAESSHLGVEEVLLDVEVGSRHETLSDSVQFSLGIKIVTILVFLGLGLIAARLYNLQIAKGSSYRVAAEDNRIRLIQKFAPRGLIVDRNGQVLARNIPSFELDIIPKDIVSDETARGAMFAQIKTAVNLSDDELNAVLKNINWRMTEPVTIKQGLNQDQALSLQELVNKYSGVQIESNPTREYIEGPVFAHLIGYVGKITQDEWQANKSNGAYALNDTIGKAGLEDVFEKSLKGKNGGTQVEVDASGRITKSLQEIAPTPGQDLKLTIDADLQRLIYNSLQDMMKKYPSSTGAAAVALDPKTGEVLSLVSLPSFDNNLFANGIKSEDYSKLINDPKRPMFDRVIQGVYPPGSTVKPVMAAAALQEGVITPQTKIVDKGSIQVGSYVFHGWKASGLGVLDVINAIAQSSDPFFYEVGGGYDPDRISGLGVDRIAKYFQEFHLGSPLGIDLPGEASGRVPTPAWKAKYFAGTEAQKWYLGDTYHMSIGQGDVLATPLQVAAYTAAFADWGKIMKPILTAQDKQEVIAQPNVDRKYIDIVRQGMRANVVSGSGHSLADLPIPVAGKTGTAQYDASDMSKTHAWFTSFAPYDNPQIVITVMVEGGGEGHQAAAPVVHEALKWWEENRYNK